MPLFHARSSRAAKALEAVAGELGKKRIAVAKVPVGCGGADAGEPRGLGEAEAGRAVLLDQIARRLEQDLLQIAVVIGARPVPALIVGAHVRGFYMKGPNAAISPRKGRRRGIGRARSGGNPTRGELTPKPISPQPRPAMML
jgi:hypothetical protein